MRLKLALIVRLSTVRLLLRLVLRKSKCSFMKIL